MIPKDTIIFKSGVYKLVTDDKVYGLRNFADVLQFNNTKAKEHNICYYNRDKTELLRYNPEKIRIYYHTNYGNFSILRCKLYYLVGCE